MSEVRKRRFDKEIKLEVEHSITPKDVISTLEIYSHFEEPHHVFVVITGQNS